VADKLLTPAAEVRGYLGAVQTLFDHWRRAQREVECGLELGATDSESAICVEALQQIARAVADLCVPTAAAPTQQALLALMGAQIERYRARLRGEDMDDTQAHSALEEMVAFGYALHQLVLWADTDLPTAEWV